MEVGGKSRRRGVKGKRKQKRTRLQRKERRKIIITIKEQHKGE